MKRSARVIERLDLQFDGRAWSIGYAASNETQGAATEYVLPGETVHAWTELVTRAPAARGTACGCPCTCGNDARSLDTDLFRVFLGNP